jgi:hypothetical protein
MGTYLGDLGIIFLSLLIILYIMWDKVFPRD